MVRSQKGGPSNKGMKLTKPEHIGASQLISGVPPTVVLSSQVSVRFIHTCQAC
jgi:hypothetical protein